MSQYSQGRAVEYAAIHRLRDDGYEIMRGSSSKGFADVGAVKQGEFLFVSVKRTTMPPPAERAHILRLAALLPGVGVPLVVLGPASKVTFRRLTGPGPGDWTPWTPDYADTQGAVA